MDLRIYIKQTQQLNINNQPIYYTGPNPQTLSVVVNGTLPANRQWPNFPNFTEVTDKVSDLFKLKLTWTEDRDSSGTSTPGAFQPKRSASGTITFEDDAYLLLKKWLADDVSAPLNSVDVKIEHVGCGWYENWVIKAIDIKWCDDGNQLCTFDVTIKQRDEPMNCIRSTMIADNHLKWFQPRPDNGKKHPRFSYCNEIRPNGLLVLIFFVTCSFGFVWATILTVIIAVIALIASIINAIIGVINIVIGVVNTLSGKNIKKVKPIKVPNPLDAFEAFERQLVESAGCGREHPAPLVRDYITNVCKKCGIDTDSLPTTASIFFATTITIQTSDPTRGSKGVITVQNPHYNACFFNAPVKRGIRRFTSLNVFSGLTTNTTDYWIPDNVPQLTLDMFLDLLKSQYNAEWRIKTVNNKPTLYFQRKDFYVNGMPLLDFTANGADRDKLLQGICFEWNEVKYPAACRGLYAEDAIDVCGNEARGQVNGAVLDGVEVTFGKTDDNPNFEGILDKTIQIGSAKFRLDGSSTDYIYDAMSVALNSTIIGNFFTGVFQSVATHFSHYADYALLLKDEIAALPKMIIWDGKSYENARSVVTHSAYDNMPNYTPPVPNPLYNNYPPFTINLLTSSVTVSGILPWKYAHPPHTNVLGISIGSTTAGIYTVQNIIGSVIAKLPAVLVNYPMYFNPGFQDTLWDWFHWIDDPRRNPGMQVTWTTKLELCCDMLKKLQLFGDGNSVVLGEKVKLPLQYYPDSKIKEITLSYDPEDELGQYIEIKGTA